MIQVNQILLILIHKTKIDNEEEKINLRGELKKRHDLRAALFNFDRTIWSGSISTPVRRNKNKTMKRYTPVLFY